MHLNRTRIAPTAWLLALVCAALAPTASAASGVSVEYFANQDLSGAPVVVDTAATVAADWGAGAPTGLPADGFSARWSAGLVPPEGGDWQLVVQASGGVRLWLDEHHLIDDWQGEDARELTSPLVGLIAGARHRLVVEFVDRSGPAALQLLWQRGPRDREVVPAALWTTPDGVPGVSASYHEGRDPESGSPLLARTDATIDFDWKSGSPDPVVPKDRFSARWIGDLTPASERVVQLIARTDDGVRVRVDGSTVIDRWKDRAVGDSYSVPFAVESGTTYRVEMDYYENGGKAVARLLWREAYHGREAVGAEAFELLGLPEVIDAAYSPFCLELPLPPGAEGVLEVDGETVALTRVTPHSAFADVVLDPRKPTKLSYQVDGRSYQLEQVKWRAVDLGDAGPLLLRAGDAIQVQLPGSAELELLEGSGIAAGASATVLRTSDGGKRTLCSFDRPGYFTLRAVYKGNRQAQVRDVIVVDTDLDEKRFAAQVGYARAGTVSSTPEASYVRYASTDGSLLAVGHIARDGSEDRISIQPLKRGTPVIIARLGGPSGPVVDLAEVDEFTLETLGKGRLIGRDVGGVTVASAKVVITPFIDDLWVELRMFAGKSTFSGGLRSASFNTSNGGQPQPGRPPLGYEQFVRVFDEGAGEEVAVLDYEVELIGDVPKACHRVLVGQVNSPFEQVSDPKNNNPKICIEYCDRPATFSIYAPQEVEICVGDLLDLDEPDIIEIEKARICYISVNGADCPDCKEVSMPAPGYEIDGLDGVDTNVPGIYTVTYRLKPDDDCVVCDPCESAVTVTVSDYTCSQSANVTEVTIDGPVVLKPGEVGTWTATAKTVDGKMKCGNTGKEKDCPVTGVDWSMSAGDKPGDTNTISRSWDTPGTYMVSATGDPLADCCLGSGTSGDLEVVVECEADEVSWKVKWDAEPIKEFLKRVKDKADKMPNVKSFTLAILGSIELEAGEKCCPGDAEPTPYKKGSGSLNVKLKGELFAPPPFAAFGALWWDAKTPGWFGDPWTLGRGELKWQFGLFGGAEITAGVKMPQVEFSECGNCVKAQFGGKGTVKGGIAGQVKWDFWLGSGHDDPPQTKGRLSVEAAISTALEAVGWVKVGSASGCDGWDVDVCWDGFTVAVKVNVKVKGFGSLTVTLYEDTFLSNC